MKGVLTNARMLQLSKHLLLSSNHSRTLCFLPRQPSPLETFASSSSCRARNCKDAYFSLIHQITNIVRRDFFLERTLNKLKIPVTSELVFRVLRACSQSPSESMRFFSWARSFYSPTSIEYEELMRNLVRSKKYSSMWKLITQLKNQFSGVENRFSISCETVCFIIEQYGQHGLIDQSVEVFNKCRSLNCEQNLNVHHALLSALCDAKLFNGAYALVRRMIRKGLAPNKETYAILVNGWCSCGKLREAKMFIQDLGEKGFNPPVRGRDLLMEGMLTAGYLEDTKEMVLRMTKERYVPDVGTFNLLMQVVCKSEQVDFCVDIYHSMCKLGFRPDLTTYKILIPAVSKVGRINEAFSLLHSAMEVGHKPAPSLYAPMIKGMFRIGCFDDAACFFGEMKVKGHPPNRPVYTMLITMCGRAGRYLEAANYLMEMTEMGLSPMPRCFDMVVDGLKKCGKYDLAKRLEQHQVALNIV